MSLIDVLNITASVFSVLAIISALVFAYAVKFVKPKVTTLIYIALVYIQFSASGHGARLIASEMEANSAPTVCMKELSE